MSSRIVGTKEEHRDQESSDDETPVISVIETPVINEIRMMSRLPGPSQRSRTNIANMPGTSGSQLVPPPAPPPSSAASPARRSHRFDRDRLFWTLMNHNRMALRYRSSEVSNPRGARPSSFVDLYEADRRPQHSSTLNSSGSQSVQSSALTASLRDMFSKLSHQREANSTRTGGVRACASRARQLMMMRRARANWRTGDALDGTHNSTRLSDDDMEIPVGSPQAADGADDYEETVIQVEEPINMSTGAMSLEEIVELEPEPEPEPASASAPEPAPSEETPSASTEESNQQMRGRKRKRDVTSDTHESVSTLNHSLLRLLECPVCMEWMEPPIVQCRRGHLVCGACRKRLDLCPVCRTSFSSVRNRAMEDVAGILRYPCRHGCGREVRLGRRGRHEASCAARRYACPLPACEATPHMPLAALPAHCQSCHPQQFRSGACQRVSLRVNCEQHQQWAVGALGQLFHARVDLDVRAWGLLVYVAFVGPQNQAHNYTYEVSVSGRHHARKLSYKRTTHSDLESPSVNTSRQDCFHLSLDQALNFLRFKNEHSETDKTLECIINLAEVEPEDESREISDSGGTNV